LTRHIEMTLPTLHPGQVDAYNLQDKTGERARFKAIRCGRRWGKTDFGKVWACDGLAKGLRVGWFTPIYKFLAEPYNEIMDLTAPIRGGRGSIAGGIKSVSRGKLDFWTLDNDRAGRGRKYHRVIIDEAAFTKPEMMQTWNLSVAPTLTDYAGSALVMSTPNGISQDNFFWRICNEPEHGFTEFHAPTETNPHMPAAELVRLKETKPPLVYRQEYDAEFIDWSGVQFFNLEHCLVAGAGVPYPSRCDAVLATIDTAVKTGTTNDATAVCCWARNKHAGHPLILLDYEIIQVAGDLLTAWLPSVFRRLDELATQCGARRGSLGVWIEDKQTGSTLLMAAARRSWPAHPIDGAFTAIGKDERAISVGDYVYQGKVKISEFAYNKIVTFKERTRNHMLTQVFGFRIGVKDQEDDLLDAFVYGVSITLGDSKGI
jgi:hypothetical protein